MMGGGGGNETTERRENLQNISGEVLESQESLETKEGEISSTEFDGELYIGKLFSKEFQEKYENAINYDNPKVRDVITAISIKNGILTEDNGIKKIDINKLLSKDFFEQYSSQSVIINKKRFFISRPLIMRFFSENKEFNFSLEKINKIVKEKKKKDIFEEFEKNGLLEKRENLIIFDVQRFRNEFSSKHSGLYNQASNFLKRFKNLNTITAIQNVFENCKVISKEDYDKGEREPKDLFYLPKNSDDALDINKIKQSKFYLNLKDIIRSFYHNNFKYGNIENLDYREVLLPVFIYHPQYGDGYRDESTGKLMVRGKNGEYQKFSAEYIYRNYGTMRDEISGMGVDSGRRFLRTVAPHLIENDLIRLTDIQINRNQGDRTDFDQKKIGRRGVVMFDNVRHTLGFQYENDVAHKLNSKIGAVTEIDPNRNKKIVALFNIVSENDAKITSRDYIVANIEMTNPQPFDWTNFREKRESETLEEYRERINMVENFQYVIQSEKYLSEKFGISLEKFSPREQFMIAKMFNSGEKRSKRLDNFVIDFGDIGLKSFLSLEHGGQEMGQKILNIGEKYDQETADKIFAKYAELADYAQDSAQYLVKEFNIKDEAKAQEIAEHLLRRGKALLAVCAEENLSSEQVIDKLSSIKAEVDIFKESFKLVKSGGENFSLENINVIQLKIKAGVELLREEKTVKRMREIYLENYLDFPEEFRQKIIESLDKKLANSQARFYTLYHKGEIVAFNSFTPREDGTVHFANFNVDPEYSFSKLGEAMMEVSLDKESQKNTIVAEAVEGLPIAETYLNKKGFQKTGEIELSGVRLINIRKEKSN